MFKRLQRAVGEWAFSDRAKWLAADGVAPSGWYMLEGEFTASGRTVLLLCAPNGAEVMLDGELIHRFVTRSYPYCPVYEALEMTPLTDNGTHKLGLLLRGGDTGGCGDALVEIVSGTERFSGGSGSFPLKAFTYPAMRPGAYFYLGNGIKPVFFLNVPTRGRMREIVSHCLLTLLGFALTCRT